jgi:hypothetical protein
LHRTYFDHRDEGIVRGWRSIHVSDGDQPHEALVGCGIANRLRTQLHSPGCRFPEGIETGKPAGPTFRDALETQHVCDAVLKSARTDDGRRCEVIPALSEGCADSETLPRPIGR